VIHLARKLVLILVLACGGTVGAQTLDTPKGKVVLTVGGQIGVKNKGTAAVFDMAMLEKLPQSTFTTKTPWDNQPVKFSGPLLRDVLDAVQAKGNTIKAIALNDYKISIPAEDARKFGVVMALKMDDKAIPVRTKGPLFIVYPFDSAKELQSATYYERSIWQLKAVELE